tara:strand:- start:900 stop:2090 length:1191 start_codon:yes stop_codon:yes gene_type:complete
MSRKRKNREPEQVTSPEPEPDPTENQEKREKADEYFDIFFETMKKRNEKGEMLDRDEASKFMKIRLTTFKKRCKLVFLERWPARAINAFIAHINNLNSIIQKNLDEIKEENETSWIKIPIILILLIEIYESFYKISKISGQWGKCLTLIDSIISIIDTLESISSKTSTDELWFETFLNTKRIFNEEKNDMKEHVSVNPKRFAGDPNKFDGASKFTHSSGVGNVSQASISNPISLKYSKIMQDLGKRSKALISKAKDKCVIALNIDDASRITELRRRISEYITPIASASVDESEIDVEGLLEEGLEEGLQEGLLEVLPIVGDSLSPPSSEDDRPWIGQATLSEGDELGGIGFEAIGDDGTQVPLPTAAQLKKTKRKKNKKSKKKRARKSKHRRSKKR